MNELSLTHSYNQNQHQTTSWIDGPFSSEGFVAGVTKVSNHIRNLNDYTQDLVSSYATYHKDHYELTLDMLSFPCQSELARLYIESIDREIEWACYGDDQTLNSDFLCAMLAMFKDNTSKTREKFAQVTSRNILIYYKNTLNELLQEACDDFYCNEMENASYRADIYEDYGVVAWSE